MFGILKIFLVVLVLAGCSRRPDPPLRQWYPIDRCRDYAKALGGRVDARCVGCVGVKCDVSVTSAWTQRVDIHKLDCSGKVCLSR